MVNEKLRDFVMNNYYEISTYRCWICDYEDESEQSVMEHIESDHYEDWEEENVS